mgnify:CR=1 FL=1
MVTGATLFIGSYALLLLLLASISRSREICIDNPLKALFSWSGKANKNDFRILDLTTIHEGEIILNVHEDDLIKLTIKPAFV